MRELRQSVGGNELCMLSNFQSHFFLHLTPKFRKWTQTNIKVETPSMITAVHSKAGALSITAAAMHFKGASDFKVAVHSKTAADTITAASMHLGVHSMARVHSKVVVHSITAAMHSKVAVHCPLSITASMPFMAVMVLSPLMAVEKVTAPLMAVEVIAPLKAGRF